MALASKVIPFVIALIIFPIYLINVTPGYTWSSAGVDHFDFIFAGTNWLVPHSTGFPLYNLAANLITDAFNNAHPAWLMALTLSTIPTIITGINIYFITKTASRNFWAPIIAMLAFLASPPVLAQTFIVEVYTFSMMMMTFTLLFHVKRKYTTAAIFMGLTLGTHGLMITMMFFLGLFWIKYYWKRLPIIILIPLGLYATIPFLFNNIQNPLEVTTLTGNTIKDWYAYLTLGSSIFWWGTLPIWEVPQRLYDTLVLLTTGFGFAVLTLILNIRYDFKRYWKYWAIAATTLYYWLTVTVEITHVHFALAFPFLAIFAGLGVVHLNRKIPKGIIVIPSIIAIAIIPFNWDIGNNLDKDLDAQTFYDNLEVMNNLPGKDIFVNATILHQEYKHDGELTDGTAIWWAILQYRRVSGNTDITPIFPDRYNTLGKYAGKDNLGLWYRTALNDNGVKTPNTTIQRDTINHEWYLNWNNDSTKHIVINDEAIGAKELDDFWVPKIQQLQLWLTIDLMAHANPDTRFWIMERTGLKEIKNTPIRYNHTLMPLEIENEIARIYREAAKF